MSTTLEVTAYPCNRGEACGNIQFTGGRCRVCNSFAGESRFYRLSDLAPELQAEWHAREAEVGYNRRRAAAELSAGPEARTLALLNSFPCLRRKGITQWDSEALRQESCAWSYGERLCVDFVLSVWNPEDYPAPDLHEALKKKKWDDDNREAFLAWARAPWWP